MKKAEVSMQIPGSGFQLLERLGGASGSLICFGMRVSAVDWCS